MNKFNEREERIEAMGRECGATAAMRVNEAAEYQAEALPGKEAWQYLQDEAGAVTARERDVFIRGFCDQYYEMVDFQKEEKGWRVKSKSLSAIALVCFLVAGAAGGCGDEVTEVTQNIDQIDGSKITKQDIYRVVYADCIDFCRVLVPKLARDCGLADFRTEENCLDCLWEGAFPAEQCYVAVLSYGNSGPYSPERCQKAKETIYLDGYPFNGLTIFISPYYPSNSWCVKTQKRLQEKK